MNIDKNALNKHSPAYYQLRQRWSDTLDLYEPIPGSLSKFLIRYPKEDDPEYAARLKRLAQVNVIKLTVEFYLAMLFSTQIRVTAKEHKDAVDAFVARCNQKGDSLVDYFKNQVAPPAFVFGNVDVFLDMPRPEREAVSLADQQAMALKPYAFVIPPLNRVRWQVDDSGRYSFYQSQDVIDTQINPQLQIKSEKQYQCWTPKTMAVYRKDGSLADEERPNPYGLIPAVTVSPLSSVRYYDDKLGIPLVDDQIDLQKEILNTLNLISDFHAQINFSMLTISQDVEAAPVPEDESEVKEVGSHRGMFLKGDKSKAYFVSPSPEGVKAMQEYLMTLIDLAFKIALIPINSTDIKTHTSASTIRTNFAQLYNRLVRISKAFAQSMKQVIDMALTVQGLDAEEAGVEVEWGDNFSYEAFSNAVAELSAIREAAGDISPTAIKEIAKQVFTSRLYSSGKMDKIQSEIDKWSGTTQVSKGGKAAPVTQDEEQISEIAEGTDSSESE